MRNRRAKFQSRLYYIQLSTNDIEKGMKQSLHIPAGQAVLSIHHNTQRSRIMLLGTSQSPAAPLVDRF